jgi:hypothetical protein
VAPPTIDSRPRPIAEPAAPVTRSAPDGSRNPAERRRSTELTATAHSSGAIERQAPTAPPSRLERNADTSDGSAAVDWLLKDRR